MVEVSRKRLLINFVIGVFTLSAVTVAIYFVGVGGGLDRRKMAIAAVFGFVIAIVPLSLGTISYARNPNHRPTLNPKMFFWVGLPMAFMALVEIFHLSTGILLTILDGLLGAAGVPVPKTVIVTLSWIAMGIGVVLAALFLRWVWRRFNAASE
jgi:hypothetical protein